jgi:hypothetical protein
LFRATLLSNRSMKEVDSIPEVQVMDILHIDGKDVLFTAKMSGPIARLISGKKDAWPIPPILIEKKQLVLSMQGTPRGLSNFLQEIKQLIGSRFTLTVNKSYQGEWLTAIHMGYYDHPRQCKQQDIAQQMNRKQGTIAEHLLLAEGNILKAWYEQSRNLD